MYTEHVDAAARAAFLDGARARSADNPITKALATGNAPFSDPQRSTFRSLDAPAPISQQVEILDARAFDVEPVRRPAAEQILNRAVASSEVVGGAAKAFIVEAGGSASGRYAFTLFSSSHYELEVFYARLAESGSMPLADGVTNGVLTMTAREILTRFSA